MPPAASSSPVVRAEAAVEDPRRQFRRSRAAGDIALPYTPPASYLRLATLGVGPGHLPILDRVPYAWRARLRRRFAPVRWSAIGSAQADGGRRGREFIRWTSSARFPRDFAIFAAIEIAVSGEISWLSAPRPPTITHETSAQAAAGVRPPSEIVPHAAGLEPISARRPCRHANVRVLVSDEPLSTARACVLAERR